MNAPEPFDRMFPTLDQTEPGRIAALNRFALDQFQCLLPGDLLLAQSIAGHGGTWGIWETPKTICPGKLHPSFRAINLHKRLHAHLVKEGVFQVPHMLLEEGVLIFTRLALLMRLAPASGRSTSKNQRLKPASLANFLYQHVPRILARALRRKVESPFAAGLLACMTEEDVRDLAKKDSVRVEIERIGILATKGMWTDVPPQPDIYRTTDPHGAKSAPMPQEIPREYQPIPDEYLAEFGPRNLWLIRDLGPNLLPLLEGFAGCLENLDWSAMSQGKLRQESGIVSKFIARHLREYPWKDRAGRPLKPPFPLAIGANRAKNKFEWPPRTYQHLQILSVTLQSAHMFLTLLASAGRIGEVESLPRWCVTSECDGKDYVRGWTYKLSANLFGDVRQWPAPAVLVQAIGQQARLVAVWSRLPSGRLENGLSKVPPEHNALWLSLGTSGASSAAVPLGHAGAALQKLAERIGMDPQPDGINLHPHRCRKTIGRLAGVALFNSPLVLKRLFGHKSIEMTLHYILCNQDIRTEAEAVLRELRILHCAQALEEVREALAQGTPLPGHGGVAAARLVDAVKDHEARLAASGRVWRDGSAYELAYLLTANGQGWRFIRKNIVCAKVPGESGLCRKNRGVPDIANCKPHCDNRIVLALERRDVAEVVESYIDVARRARDDGQYMVCYEAMQRLLEELEAFADIREKYMADQLVKSLLATYHELAK